MNPAAAKQDVLLGGRLFRGRENNEEALDVLTEALDAVDRPRAQSCTRFGIIGHPLSIRSTSLKALAFDDTEPPGSINHPRAPGCDRGC
jgi:hypothetical protein